MSAMISDVVEANITPSVANAAVNAGGKLLKIVEMQHRYGSRNERGMKVLPLAEFSEDKRELAARQSRIEELESQVSEAQKQLARLRQEEERGNSE